MLASRRTTLGKVYRASKPRWYPPGAMGVECDLACVTCREWVWLGSMKPWKWSGFQMGNAFVAELLSLHATPSCRLIVTSDARAFVPPWQHDDAESGWLEDLRSRWYWDSVRHDATPPRMACATCEAPLDVSTSADAEALRQEGFRSAPGAAAPLIVGRYLWFCGPACRDRHRSGPGRAWRAQPDASPHARVRVGCLHCGVETSLGAREPDESDALAFAEWLVDHVYDPPAALGLDAPGCCRLEARVETPAEVPEPDART